MVGIKFKINGRDVRAGDVGLELNRVLAAGVQRNVAERIGRAKRLRCAAHGKSPTLQATRDGFSIGACCERFRDEIQRELGR